MKKFLNLNVKNSKHKKLLRFMKYFLIFILLGVGSCFANETYSQRTFFTFEYKNRTVKEIIQEIEQSSEYIFFYMDNSVNLNRKVSVKADNETVEKILDQLFAGTRNQYYISDRQIIISSAKIPETTAMIAPIVQQQGRTITGVVSDASGPVIGANVIVKGTTNGAVTDINGQFTITNVQPNTILVVSFIGYLSQEVNVGNQTQFNIIIREDVGALEEVVVVGYGVQRRETLTGAVASVSAAEIVSTKTNNVVSNLQGKMPGLLIRQQTGEPGDFQSLISIRGYGTPIVVINGVVSQRNGVAELSQINPDDIENISILKDASAAIYGMNSANGVIIVTTKKGSDGKAVFSYSGRQGYQMPTGLPKMMPSWDYELFMNELYRNSRALEPYTMSNIMKYKNGEVGYPNSQWLEMYLKDRAASTNHTFSVRGGSDKVSYFTSIGYNKDDGLYNANWYDRFTFRNNMSAKVTDHLRMNVNLSGRVDRRMQTGEFAWIYKTLLVNDPRVETYTRDPATGQLTNHISLTPPETLNALSRIDPNVGGYNRYQNFNTSLQVDVTYSAPFLKGLDVNVLGAIDNERRNYESIGRAHDLYSYSTDQFMMTQGQNRYSNTMNLYQKIYGKIQVNYAKKIDDHSLTVMGAFEASELRFDDLMGQRTFDFWTYPIINQGSEPSATNSGSKEFRRFAAFFGRFNYDYKGKYMVEGMVRYDGSYRYAPGKRWALFPSVNVGWRISEESFFKDNIRFINNLKLRTTYGESGQDTGSAHAWISAYTLSNFTGYMFTASDSWTAGLYPPGVVNNKMTWMTAKLFNVGLDADLLSSKLNFNFEYFYRKVEGILATRASSAPNFFGASFPQENLDSQANIGLELSVKYRDRIGKDFSYTVGANVTYARLKRLHVERTPFTSQYNRWRNSNQNRLIGRAGEYRVDGYYTSLQQYETAPLLGAQNGNTLNLPGSFILADINGDGIINSDDQMYTAWIGGTSGYTYDNQDTGSLGTANRVNPPLQFGGTIDLKYKSFDFSLVLAGSALYSLVHTNTDIWGLGFYPMLDEKWRDRWHTEPLVWEEIKDASGKVVDVNVVWPDPFDPGTQWIPGYFPALKLSNSSGHMDRTTGIQQYRPNTWYLRVKTVELGYSLPKAYTAKAGITGLRVFINTTNLLTFCEKRLKKIDPERQENLYNAGLAYPIMKAVNFGLNLNF